MRWIITIVFSISTVLAFAQPTLNDVPKTPRQAIVIGQQMVDAGELEEALPYLKMASDTFPDNDAVLAMYGQALYEAKQIAAAEVIFRRALQINPLNRVAKSYVEEIRGTSAATQSLEYQQMQEVAVDKLGDVLVLAFGFLLATATRGFFTNLTGKRFVAKTRKHFLGGQYDDFADLLEIQLSTNELKPLRESLNFMLEHKTPNEAIEILERYVNTEENLATLTRMIKLAAGRNHV